MFHDLITFLQHFSIHNTVRYKSILFVTYLVLLVQLFTNRKIKFMIMENKTGHPKVGRRFQKDITRTIDDRFFIKIYCFKKKIKNPQHLTELCLL